MTNNENLPLTDADFAAVRRSVLATIAAQEQRRRRLTWSFAFAAAAAAIVLAVVMMPSRSLPERRQIAALHLKRGITLHKHPPAVVTTAAAPILAEVHMSSQPKSRRHSVRPHHRRMETPATLIAKNEPMSIQLQTNDPDVRIIWITR
jgi:hypothetical protein